MNAKPQINITYFPFLRETVLQLILIKYFNLLLMFKNVTHCFVKQFPFYKLFIILVYNYHNRCRYNTLNLLFYPRYLKFQCFNVKKKKKLQKMKVIYLVY